MANPGKGTKERACQTRLRSQTLPGASSLSDRARRRVRKEQLFMASPSTASLLQEAKARQRRLRSNRPTQGYKHRIGNGDYERLKEVEGNMAG